MGLETLRVDLRAALRTLRNAPAFTAVAVLSLGIGVGANTTVFSAINALLLRPLPVSAPDELVSVYRRRSGLRWASMSYGEFGDVRGSARSFRGLAALTAPGLQMSVREGLGQAVATPVALVSSEYFGVLGLRAQHGRLLDMRDDDARTLGRGIPVVISDRLWRGRFNGVTDIVGRGLMVNGRGATVVGVAPARFSGTFTALPADVWLPLSAHPLVVNGLDSLQRRDSRFLNVVGRLAHGVDRAHAEAELAVLAERFARAHPATDRELGFTLTSTTGVVPFVRQGVTGFLALLLGIAGSVLLVACSNLAGLLLARGANRHNELAVRTALGATRWRLLRQLGLEATLLAGLGAAAGLLLAQLGVTALLRSIPELGIPIEFDLRLDWRVLSFSVAASFVAALLFGGLPALQLTRPALTQVLREDASSAGRVRMRLRGSVVVVQIALSVVLLASTILLLRGLRRASAVDLGFNPARVVLLNLDPALVGYDRSRRAELYRRLLERLRARPEVERAAIAQYTLLGSRGDRVEVTLPEPGQPRPVPYNAVTPDYFAVLGLQVVQGRVINTADTYESPAVGVVGETMARQLWPGKNALGQRFRVNDQVIEVVGVVRDAKYRTLGEQAQPFVFFPVAQIDRVLGDRPVSVVVHARVRGSINSALASVRRELHALDPDIPARVSRMTSEIEFSVFPARLASRVIFTCALFAILLAVVGLHAVAAYTVARRTRELGIRLALGAQRSDVMRLVAGQSARLSALGLAVGVPIAWAAAQLLRSFRYGVPTTDPVTYLVVALVLGATVIAAIGLPVRRAARMDPLQALRSL